MACKITRHIEEREISEEEFIKQKSFGVFETLRQLGKSTNFLMIFGGSPRVFVETALEVQWSEEQTQQFIRDNKLDDLLDRLKERYPRESDTMLRYLAVATFSLYKGLARRIEANREFARNNGYVRGLFGATRKLIEELLRGSYDEREHGAMLRNLDNVCANTDIQNLEASVVNAGMIEIDNWLRETNKLSMIWNNVHDSCDLYVHKAELIEVCEKAAEILTKSRSELKGVPLAVDFTICDLSKGDYYKHGKSLASFKRETADL